MTEANKVPATETDGKPKRVGFLLEKLDEGLFENIVGIYGNVFGGDSNPILSLENAVETAHQTLSRTNVVGFRFGSVFSDNSKLEIIREFSSDSRALEKEVVSIGFYENTFVRPEKQAELEQLKLHFEQSITSLLMEKELTLLLD